MASFKIDCLLLTVPRVSQTAPIIAPALLKSHLKRHGFTSKVIDYNIRLYNDVGDVGDIWKEDDEYFDKQEEYSIAYNNVLKSYIETYAKECIEEQAEWIGISLLSSKSTFITSSLIKEIRKLGEQKIVIGGPGADHYNSYYMNLGLAVPDEIILGDGDEALVSLLKGERVKKTYYYLKDLSNLPIPDYSDLNWTDYDDDPVKVPITGSRGCVRKCTFCDVKHYWPSFRYRSGKEIAEEMAQLFYQHGYSTFGFTDSLINGSLKAFRELCTELKRVNIPTTWNGQFICRSEKQMPESLWADMAAAGCTDINIGIESGSEKVREHMKKKFSNEDMFYTFEMATKYGIQVVFNIIVGYPTETEEDFDDTLLLLKNISELNKQLPIDKRHIIGSINLCTIIDNCDLRLMLKELNIEEFDTIPVSGAGHVQVGPAPPLNWKMIDKMEGLPYSQNIRVGRLIKILTLLEHEVLQIEGPPRSYEFNLDEELSRELFSGNNVRWSLQDI
jgi:hypothetical protein